VSYHRVCSTAYGPCIVNINDKYVCKALIAAGAWCPHELALLQQLVPVDGVIIEAGANYGAHTLAFARFVGNTGRVYAFEPQRIVFQALCGSVALNGLSNVIVRNSAVGGEAGAIDVPVLDYTAIENFGGVSLTLSGHEGRSRFEQVPVETIDGLSLSACNLIKADVEGMELDVIKGGLATIRRCRPILYLENHAGGRHQALIELCRSLDYDLYLHGIPTDPNMLGLPRERAITVKGLNAVP